MTLKKIKKIVSESMFLKILLSILIIGIAVFYFKTFFTYGVYFGTENIFLKKKELTSETHYIGSTWNDDYQIVIKGVKNTQSSVEVVFELPNDIHRQYTVTFKDAIHWDKGIHIKDTNGNIIFKGEYLKNSPFLFDEIGNPVMSETLVLVNGETPYTEAYKVPLKTIADLAMFSNETFRGEIAFLILALFSFLLTAIDYKFPLFFFKLKNILEVKDPEPHDFYILTQRISWYVLPVIGLILLIIAIL
ncbi:hypothetical protein [Lederbergia panacisoli]|uniref:hypothetical protein n=1 Tax=Lederbergia panacisoli TaxID=1255251 RepID=UPI00214AE6B7|nr:hypothetical protein [Lederbergia panacisoli]MCR2822860.1 hypothetical protein [Lederbergia panacisoli]